jgi:2,4-dichlorophenol 6-monooxygenase
VKAAADVQAQTGVPITVHAIGRGTGGPIDPYEEWAERREVDSNGCVLVRPDRHVAWRYSGFDESGPDALRAAMEHVLGLRVTTPTCSWQ